MDFEAELYMGNQIFKDFLQIEIPILADLETIWGSISMTRSRNHFKFFWVNNKSAGLNAGFDRCRIHCLSEALDFG